MIDITVNGQRVGDTAEITGPGTVTVEAWAESIFPIQRLDIVQAGKVIASTVSDTPTRRLELKKTIQVSEHTWLAARAGGNNYWSEGNFYSSQTPSLKPIPYSHYDGQRKGIFAHTSAVYVACGEEWSMFDENVARHILSVADGLISNLKNISSQYSGWDITHHHGEQDHIEYLIRPFVETREAIHKRMETLGIKP